MYIDYVNNTDTQTDRRTDKQTDIEQSGVGLQSFALKSIFFPFNLGCQLLGVGGNPQPSVIFISLEFKFTHKKSDLFI